jgi:predicted phage terminase large subunit-like protein
VVGYSGNTPSQIVFYIKGFEVNISDVNNMYRELFNSTGRDDWFELTRKLCREDLYFLITRIFKREDVERQWLLDRCFEVQRNPDGYLDLWFREGYKSTIITYALTIQEILKDPNLTIGIFSYNRPTAKTFLRQIKREFEMNTLLKSYFPEVLWTNPQSEAPKWSEDEGIVVKRSINPKESTVEAWGLVDGQPTGRHFKLLVYDDVVTLDSVTTPEMCQKTTRAWEMSINLAAEGGRKRYIGTRYSYNDTYGEMMRREVVKPRIYAIYDSENRPVLLTKERIEYKRKELGPYVFSSQMLQNPVADEAQNFSPSWIQTWSAQNTDNLKIYIIVDPASKKKKNSDYTAMHVIGLGFDKNYYIIDMIRDRLNLTERTQTLFGLHKMYRPMAVGYEEYGMQSDIEHLQYVMDQENYRFPIFPLGGNVGKEDRIRALVPLFEQKRIFLPQMCIRTCHDRKTLDLTKVFVEEEYKTFPVGQHDDMLDALARIVDHGKKGIFATFPIEEPTRAKRFMPSITQVADLEREQIWEDVKQAEDMENALYDW